MTVPGPVTSVIAGPGDAAPHRRGLLHRFTHNPMAVTAVIILGAIVIVAGLAPWLAPQDPTYVDIAAANSGPTPGHLLGADSSGRDILSRLLVASRLTLLGALIAVVTAGVIGIPSGLIAGYFRNAFDSVSSWLSNALLALPTMIVLLAVIASLGTSLFTTMAAFGVMLSPVFFRIVRGQVLAVREELYVDAARISGISNTSIIGRHVLRVVRAPIIIQASIIAGTGIIVQAGLDFLGFSDSATPTWGGMLGDAFTNIYVSPLATLWPGMAIALTVASLVVVANGLRDAVQSSPRAARSSSVTRSTDTPAARSGRESLLQLDRVQVALPNPDGTPNLVVEDVTFGLDRGEVLGVVGESGSGKTQTAFAILGLLPAGGEVVGGSILFEGHDLLGMPPADRRALRGTGIAYIPQEPMSNLDPAFRIGHQLVEPLRARHGMTRSAAKQRALELLRRVGIPEPERTFRAYPHQISGGMAQRVLIAGAVAGSPRLLIADEPTTALDVTVQAEVLDLLRELQVEMDMAMILVTHNFGVVADICDRVVVMRQGRVVETATAQRLYDAPQDPYTRMLLNSTLEDAPLRAPVGDAEGDR